MSSCCAEFHDFGIIWGIALKFSSAGPAVARGVSGAGSGFRVGWCAAGIG